MDRIINILGIPIHDITYIETLDLIRQFIAEGGAHQICTVNPEFIMAAQRDADFRAILHAADLCAPDGVGLLWASRLLGKPLRERVAGSDLVPLIAAEAAARQWRIFFLGAQEGIAAKAASILKSRFPELIVAGVWAGSPRPQADELAAAKISAANPHILFVAYGAPTQDKWIARNRDRLNAPVMIGVGGAFDFIAGAAVRAPRWLQRLGLEWLHRLIRQPWRWRRMLSLPRFAIKVLLQAWSSKI